MRIVHGFQNIAEVPITLARAQRALGLQSTALLYIAADRSARGAIDLNRLITGNRVSRKLRKARMLAWLAANCDVLHLHFHTSLLRHYQDLALLKQLGKHIVVHLHGCDIRDPRQVRQHYAVSACAECPIACLTEVKLDLPMAIRRFADAVVVATPDLLEFVPNGRFIPNPLDLSVWEDLRIRSQPTNPHREHWVVAHAPTDRAIKGTRYVEAAVAELQAEGLPVELRLLQGLTRDQVQQACLDADVVVDQVLIGWFGLFAVEMLALGKPVVAYIRSDLQPVQPDLPIVSADPSTLTATLRRLLLSADWRAELAHCGPPFVRQHHSITGITQQIVELYREIGAT